jgi:hypothetical protein
MHQEVQSMTTEDPGNGIGRRRFLRKAAVAGAAAAWATPVVNTITASPAFAQVGGSPKDDPPHDDPPKDDPPHDPH